MKHYSIIALLLPAVTAAAWGQEPICPPGGTIYQVGHVLYRHPPGGRASTVDESTFFMHNHLRFRVNPAYLSGVRIDGLRYRALTIKVVFRSDESRYESRVYEFAVPDEFNTVSNVAGTYCLKSKLGHPSLDEDEFILYTCTRRGSTKYPSLIYTGDVCMWREDTP